VAVANLWEKTGRNELTLQEVLLAARLLQRADIELAPMRAFLEPATRLTIALIWHCQRVWHAIW